MNEDRSEVLVDLLIKQATEGLTDAETAQLDRLENESNTPHDTTFERTAAAVGMVDLPQNEQMPTHLRARLIAKAEEVFDELGYAGSSAVVLSPEADARRRSFWGWMGWAIAAAACMALVINIWLTRVQPRPDIAQTTPTPSPEVVTPARQRKQLMESAGDLVRANVGPGTMPGLKDVSGDIVWSDSRQAAT
jgi:hypothetical protein